MHLNLQNKNTDGNNCVFYVQGGSEGQLSERKSKFICLCKTRSSDNFVPFLFSFFVSRQPDFFLSRVEKQGVQSFSNKWSPLNLFLILFQIPCWLVWNHLVYSTIGFNMAFWQYNLELLQNVWAYLQIPQALDRSNLHWNQNCDWDLLIEQRMLHSS